METAFNFAVCVVHAILFFVDDTCQLYDQHASGASPSVYCACGVLGPIGVQYGVYDFDGKQICADDT